MGLFNIFGKVAKLGGTAANLVDHPEFGIPLTVAGGAVEGASSDDGSGGTGGLKGGLVGGLKSGVSAAMPTILKGASSPVDLGDTTAFSSTGSPVTVPGARANPIEGLFGASGKPLDIPASPTKMGGS